jgi:16S rRNA (guanine966-N2)-methyltransferase
MAHRGHDGVPPARNCGAPRGSVRIIGGRWRGRRLPVLADAGLRPSTDRVRETLFNWLQARLPGARCLDLFAGTGALGFEAVSRGAAAATLVEVDRDLVRQLSATRTALKAVTVEIIHADAIRWLVRRPVPFDIVFIDPPFDGGFVPEALRLLEQGWIAPAGLVYVERRRDSGRDRLPKHWRIVREGETRHVSYALIRREIGP